MDGNRLKQTVRSLVGRLGGGSDDEPIIYAVSNCHPTRVALYAAAFQGGWKVEFMKSLQDVVKASRKRKPKAVFYDHGDGQPWDQYCSTLSAQGIPFILLGHKRSDETFLVLLARGGYHAWGNPLASEDIVKAVEFAEEVAGLPHMTSAASSRTA